MVERIEGWAIILGASSGFGGAAGLALARAGLDIVGVHLDRSATLPNAERIAAEIRETGREALFFNVNASDPKKRQMVLDAIAERRVGDDPAVKVLFHSLAFGTLRPFITDDPDQAMTAAQMDMTIDVMANSLVYWTQGLVRSRLMGRGGRIFAVTSAGSRKVWPYYGAVSAAKSALESHIRQLAMELGPRGISANALRAGVTDTPSLRRIPGHEALIDWAKDRNPGGRLTVPEDVAEVVVAMCLNRTDWCTGNVIGVDGGENLG